MAFTRMAEGFFLQVARNGSRSWLFRYTLNGKTRHMGLGSLAVISLADARTAAIECRRLCHAGVDPLEHRKASRTEARLATARAMTFDVAQTDIWPRTLSDGAIASTEHSGLLLCELT